MNARLAETLRSLERLTESLGRPPTHRELAAELAVAASTIHHRLVALELDGYIRRERGRPCGAHVVVSAGTSGAEDGEG